MDKVWVFVGLDYHQDSVQVCVLDYRPAFRRTDLLRPEYEEMVSVWKLLIGTGLKTVICQTAKGHIGPAL